MGVDRDNEGAELAVLEHDPTCLNQRGDRYIEARLPAELLAQDWEHDHDLSFSPKLSSSNKLFVLPASTLPALALCTTLYSLEAITN